MGDDSPTPKIPVLPHKALRDERRGAASLEGRLGKPEIPGGAGLRGWDDFLAQTLIIIIEAYHAQVWSFPGAGPGANTLRAHTSP